SCCVAVDYIVSCRLFRFEINLNIFHVADLVFKDLGPDLFHFLEDFLVCVLFSCKLKEHFCLNLSLLCRSFLCGRFLSCCLLCRSFFLSCLCFCCLDLFWCIY